MPRLLPLSALLLAFCSAQVQAWAEFRGQVITDYDVGYTTADGFEEVSAWISVDEIRGTTPGPLRPPPLALVVRLSQSSDPLAPGWDVAWSGLPALYPGETIRDLYRELPAADLPAGEYWVHLLLIDDAEGFPLDARSEPFSRIWRGGIAAYGPLYVDRSALFSVYASVPELRNNRLDGFSERLELRLYRSWQPGPAAAGQTICTQRIAGLRRDESWFDVDLSCALDAPLDPDETVHLSVRALDSPIADRVSEPPPALCCGSSVDIYAGASSPLSLLLGALLGIWIRQRRPRRVTFS